MHKKLYILAFMLMMVVSWDSYLNYFMFMGVSLIWIILNSLKNLFKTSFKLINFMWVIISLFFFTKMIWMFYLLFEMNMIPMVLILMGWGINMARMTACIYMVLYTSLFSLPVLMVILNNFKLIAHMSFHINSYFLSTLSKMLFIIMFMVKIPIFGMHYWLPKAHVEASTFGSMILTSGLLKMGGLGFIKIFLWMSLILNNSWLVIGSALSSWLCCLQSDQKKLIALSSVAHMSFSTSSIMTNMNMGYMSMVLYGFTHSISSSLMFYNGGWITSFSKTRLMVYIIKFSHSLLILFVISIFVNMGIPPSISFLSELMSITTVFNGSFLSIFMIFLMLITSLLFSFIYCMMIYQSNNFCQYSSNSFLMLTFFIHMVFMFMWMNMKIYLI